MLISIITLNYNKSHLTLKCIESLHQRFEREFMKDEVEIIIVDNASQDNSVIKIKKEIEKKKYKNMILIENSENSGFGKGCNIGAKKAKGKFLLFLNNDTVVKDKGFLRMAEYLENNQNVAILGGQLRNPDNSLQVSVGSFYNLYRVLLLLAGMQRFGVIDKSPSTIKEVDWVKGGLLMIRKEVFERLHGFDEKIFMYTEDMELCYRAKIHGYKTFFYPDVLVLHAEHGSTNRTFAIVNIYKNLLYFYKKHKSSFEYLIVKSFLVLKAVVLIVAGIVMRSDYLTKTYKEALKGVYAR